MMPTNHLFVKVVMIDMTTHMLPLPFVVLMLIPTRRWYRYRKFLQPRVRFEVGEKRERDRVDDDPFQFDIGTLEDRPDTCVGGDSAMVDLECGKSREVGS